MIPLPNTPKGRRAKAHSEYYMTNFNLADTNTYLTKVKRRDISAEDLYLELNKGILDMDLMRREIISADFHSPKFNKQFQENIAHVIKHTRKLCELLGVQENGEIEHYYGQKARYAHTKHSAKKPQASENLYSGLSILGLSNSAWFKPALQMKTPKKNQSFGFPDFSNRLESIAQEINFLRFIAEQARAGTSGGKSVMQDDEYYKEKRSYELSPEQWMIARKLPQIYQDFFGTQPQVSRSRMGSKPRGAGLHFFMWCLKRMDISLTKETVCKYYYDHRIVKSL